MTEATNVLTIRTPEGAQFSLPLAGPVSRLLAFLVDQVVMVVAAGVAGAVIGGVFGLFSPDTAAMFGILLFFTVWTGYGIVLEWFWRGQTLGKYVMGLRVVDQSGLNLRFSQIVIRNLVRFVDNLPAGLIGGLACTLTRRCQRLGDLAANTVVIRLPGRGGVDLSVVRLMQENSFRAHPHLEGRLRQRVSPAMAAAALEALRRRDRLDDTARLQLFAAMADHFRSLVAFPDTTVESLSDEAYVRNVVETLYRNQVSS
ncbi:MAG: RDD family protein [Phycisphaerae bacterium]|nr:RDD family protein [Phycisphaerae bacterium]